MRPEIIVILGNFISAENNETQSLDKLKLHFDNILNIIDKCQLQCLRDFTHWIFIPSLNDPGICKVFPSFKLSESLFKGFKGKGQKSGIKNYTLGTNPMRISFRGKEIVLMRYNYFKKLKRNHLEKLQIQ